jgi:hypothetical protein
VCVAQQTPWWLRNAACFEVQWLQITPGLVCMTAHQMCCPSASPAAYPQRTMGLCWRTPALHAVRGGAAIHLAYSHSPAVCAVVWLYTCIAGCLGLHGEQPKGCVPMPG